MKKFIQLLFFFVFIKSSIAQWQQTSCCPIKGNINAFATDGSRIYAATDYGGGVFVSLDSGDTWILPSKIFKKSYVNAIFYNGKAIFAGSSVGGSKSYDGGITWIPIDSNITMPNIYSFAKNEAYLFAGTYSHGAFRSSNDGETWKAINTGLQFPTIYGLTVSSSNIYAATPGGVYKSINNGLTWSDMTIDFTFAPFIICIISCNNMVLAGSPYEGIFRSLDNGLSWTSVNSGLQTLDVRALYRVGKDFYAGTSSGVYYTIDSGTNWLPLNSGFSQTTQVESFVNLGSRIFAGSSEFGVWQQRIVVTTSECDIIDDPPIIDNDLTIDNIPNIFTPNNDGQNDVFSIKGLKSNDEVLIFNRWGNNVYTFSGMNGWDGRTKGDANCSDGIYYYVIKRSESKLLKGFIQLIR